MPGPEGGELFEYVFGQKPAAEAFSYEPTEPPEPKKCPGCGAPLTISGNLDWDGLKPGEALMVSVTITHPKPVCDGFGPALKNLYLPSE